MVALPQDQLKTVTNSDKFDDLFEKINAEFNSLDTFLKYVNIFCNQLLKKKIFPGFNSSQFTK